MNDDVPLYCESLVFATTPKSRKVVCKKSINHGNTMNKCFKKADLKEGIFIICYSAVLIVTFLFIILFASKNATLQPRAFFYLFFQIHL